MQQDKSVVLLGDGPQTYDLLGYQPYVDALAEVLARDSLETPFCIGIFGRWGTGKSTFMGLLNKQLDNREQGHYNTLFFQPWQFEEKEEVWKALLLSTLRYLEVELERLKSQTEIEYEKIKKTLTSLMLGVGKLALNKALKSISGGNITADGIFEMYANASKDNSQFINTFREEFKNIKDEILSASGNQQARLFIFVDDLDRCTPENCIMVLESIKLFFDLEECVFILGIDREVVQKGIEHKYSNSISIKGQDYLDKMIQLPFSLPPVSEETFKNFVEMTTHNLNFSESINQLVTIASESNPRRVKRLCNCLQLVREVAIRLLEQNPNAEINTPDESKLALLLTLQVRYPIAYSWLVKNPMTLNELENADLESKGEKSSTQSSLTPNLLLKEYLSVDYGKENAELVLREFKRLWHYAHEKANVSIFESKKEIEVYIGITGVVEEDRSQSVKDEVETFNTRKSVDAKYKSEFDESSEENVIDDINHDSPPPLEVVESVSASDNEKVQKRAALVKQDWIAFKTKSMLLSILRLLQLERIGLNMVEEAKLLLHFYENKPKNSLIERDLRSINEVAVYSQVIATSKLFAIVIPVFCVLIWSLALYYFSDLSSKSTEKAIAPSIIEWMSSSIQFKAPILLILLFWGAILSFVSGWFYALLLNLKKRRFILIANNQQSSKQKTN